MSNQYYGEIVQIQHFKYDWIFIFPEIGPREDQMKVAGGLQELARGCSFGAF